MKPTMTRVVTRFEGNENQIVETEKWLGFMGMNIRTTYRPLGIITGEIHSYRRNDIGRLENLIFQEEITPYQYADELHLSEEDLMGLGEHDLITHRVFGMK